MLLVYSVESCCFELQFAIKKDKDDDDRQTMQLFFKIGNKREYEGFYASKSDKAIKLIKIMRKCTTSFTKFSDFLHQIKSALLK